MNWKTEAVDKLRQYEARKNSLQSIPVEIEQLKMVRCSIRSATVDSTPVHGGGSGREDIMLSSIVKEEELKRSLVLAQKWVDLVDAGLKVLNDEERLVLERFYIRPEKGNVDRLCEVLGVEKASIYRKKDAALRHFTICLYGRTES